MRARFFCLREQEKWQTAYMCNAYMRPGIKMREYAYSI